MSVVGFDVGDFKSCVAVARRNGVDVLLNKESKGRPQLWSRSG